MSVVHILVVIMYSRSFGIILTNSPRKRDERHVVSHLCVS